MNGVWGFMCPRHYQENGSGRLGIAHGQYLIASAEVPPAVEEALQRALDYWSHYPRPASGTG